MLGHHNSAAKFPALGHRWIVPCQRRRRMERNLFAGDIECGPRPADAAMVGCLWQRLWHHRPVGGTLAAILFALLFEASRRHKHRHVGHIGQCILRTGRKCWKLYSGRQRHSPLIFSSSCGLHSRDCKGGPLQLPAMNKTFLKFQAKMRAR